MVLEESHKLLGRFLEAMRHGGTTELLRELLGEEPEDVLRRAAEEKPVAEA